MREFTIAKGQRVRVMNLLFDSIPQIVRFSATPVSGGGEVAGKVEVRGSRWLFRDPPVTYDLKPENLFQKGFWDSLYSIHVTPDQDTKIVFDTRHFHVKYLIWALAGVVVLAAAAVFVMAVIRSTAG